MPFRVASGDARHAAHAARHAAHTAAHACRRCATGAQVRPGPPADRLHAAAVRLPSSVAPVPRAGDRRSAGHIVAAADRLAADNDAADGFAVNGFAVNGFAVTVADVESFKPPSPYRPRPPGSGWGTGVVDTGFASRAGEMRREAARSELRPPGLVDPEDLVLDSPAFPQAPWRRTRFGSSTHIAGRPSRNAELSANYWSSYLVPVPAASAFAATSSSSSSPKY